MYRGRMRNGWKIQALSSIRCVCRDFFVTFLRWILWYWVKCNCHRQTLECISTRQHLYTEHTRPGKQRFQTYCKKGLYCITCRHFFLHCLQQVQRIIRIVGCCSLARHAIITYTQANCWWCYSVAQPATKVPPVYFNCRGDLYQTLVRRHPSRDFDNSRDAFTYLHDIRYLRTPVRTVPVAAVLGRLYRDAFALFAYVKTTEKGEGVCFAVLGPLRTAETILPRHKTKNTPPLQKKKKKRITVSK